MKFEDFTLSIARKRSLRTNLLASFIVCQNMEHGRSLCFKSVENTKKKNFVLLTFLLNKFLTRIFYYVVFVCRDFFLGSLLRISFSSLVHCIYSVHLFCVNHTVIKFVSQNFTFNTFEFNSLCQQLFGQFMRISSQFICYYLSYNASQCSTLYRFIWPTMFLCHTASTKNKTLNFQLHQISRYLDQYYVSLTLIQSNISTFTESIRRSKNWIVALFLIPA